MLSASTSMVLRCPLLVSVRHATRRLRGASHSADLVSDVRPFAPCPFSFLTSLISAAPNRLGRNGVAEVMASPWLAGVPWERIREVPAPYVSEGAHHIKVIARMRFFSLYVRVARRDQNGQECAASEENVRLTLIGRLKFIGVSLPLPLCLSRRVFSWPKQVTFRLGRVHLPP